jgi:hypothetical protein
LLLVPGTTQLVRPDKSGNIVLKIGDTIHLACPGTTLRDIGAAEATATCVGGIKLSVDKKIYDANKLSCDDLPKSHSWTDNSKEAAIKCKGAGRVLAKMGYQTQAGNVELIEACHDVNLHHTLYAKFHLTSDAANFRSGLDRNIEWNKGHLFK